MLGVSGMALSPDDVSPPHTRTPGSLPAPMVDFIEFFLSVRERILDGRRQLPGLPAHQAGGGAEGQVVWRRRADLQAFAAR